ncbi:MAG TPA: hypothetical protein VN426_14755 [Syntrophomonadaceae bacterium]|nr:hypothetical protein [Syntrophomonadaceae bacterium]
MKSKRLLCVFIMFILTLSVFGCSKENSNSSNSANTATSSSYSSPSATSSSNSSSKESTKGSEAEARKVLTACLDAAMKGDIEKAQSYTTEVINKDSYTYFKEAFQNVKSFELGKAQGSGTDYIISYTVTRNDGKQGTYPARVILMNDGYKVYSYEYGTGQHFGTAR